MTMPTPLRASPTSTAPSLLPQRILVVENSRTHARLIGEAIEQKLNLPVIYAATLAEARTALERHPDWFMVVTSLVLADGSHDEVVEFFLSRQLPTVVVSGVYDDGLREQVLRRQVVEQLGGFDEALRTAEDLEFHLRIARHWPIGVVEQPLVRAMRGHEGLSAASSTYDDYVRVVEKAVADARGTLDDGELDAALAGTYLRNARGMLIRRRWAAGTALARRAWRLSRDPAQRREIAGLLPFGVKRFLRGLMPG